MPTTTRTARITRRSPRPIGTTRPTCLAPPRRVADSAQEPFVTLRHFLCIAPPAESSGQRTCGPHAVGFRGLRPCERRRGETRRRTRWRRSSRHALSVPGPPLPPARPTACNAIDVGSSPRPRPSRKLSTMIHSKKVFVYTAPAPTRSSSRLCHGARERNIQPGGAHRGWGRPLRSPSANRQRWRSGRFVGPAQALTGTRLERDRAAGRGRKRWRRRA